MVTRVRIHRRRIPPLDAWHGPPEHLQPIRDALATHQRYGVWGGLAEDDRRQPVAARRRHTWAPRGRPARGRP